MHVVLTGASGFLGVRLAAALLDAEQLTVGGRTGPLRRLTLVDLVEPATSLTQDPRVASLVGSLEDVVPTVDDADLVIHLAALVSAGAERDFDLGMRSNLDGTRLVLERCRTMAFPPVVVFASSLAVYGDADGAAGPTVVDDATIAAPESSYGTQKLIGELLVADYTRKGFVRGRSLRLMTVAVRPGQPNTAASSFVSSIVREPLAGERAVCPVPPDTEIALSSPKATISAFLVAAATADGAWGATSAVNLPALTTTPREMIAAAARVGGDALENLVDWVPDETIARIFTSWPTRFATARADSLGMPREHSIDAIVEQFVAAQHAEPAGSLRPQ